ncbi:hypothetical protein D3C71_690220 [compost metagenome]
MKELDEIDQLFQTTFEGFELTPDPSVKANIDRAIASKKKRRRFFFILFPVLFGTTIFASTLYFYSNPGKTSTSNKQHISQNSPSGPHTFASNNTVKEKKTNDTLFTNSSEKTQSAYNLHSEEKISGRKNAILRPGLSNLSEKVSHAGHDSRSKQGFSESRRKNAILRLNQTRTNPPLLSGTNIVSPQTSTTPNPTENQPDQEEKTEITETSKQDSTTAASDSTNIENLVKTPETIDQALTDVKKPSGNWSLALLTGWEGEKKRAFENFDTTNFQGKRREFASIHSSSFYGKIELNRQITPRLDLMIGLGFRSTQIKQYGSLYERDSVIVMEGVGSAPSDSVNYFIDHRTGTQAYQVNSIIVPLGLSFSIPLSERFQFRISGGTEFAYGWMTKRQNLPDFSSPNFRSFGWNVWLRPEFHYIFGKYQLFGFGSFNQALSQQLKWDFTTRRNPAFGAGIGIRISL